MPRTEGSEWYAVILLLIIGTCWRIGQSAKEQRETELEQNSIVRLTRGCYDRQEYRVLKLVQVHQACPKCGTHSFFDVHYRELSLSHYLRHITVRVCGSCQKYYELPQ